MPTGYIYKLVCLDKTITDTYIGSCWDITVRKTKHKSSCNTKTSKDYKYPVYKFIREHGGWANWNIEMIEECECRDKRHRETVEQFYIDVHGGIDFLLNQHDAIRDEEKIREKQYINKKINKKRYYENTKEKKQQKFVCECGGRYTHQHRSTHNKSLKHQNYITKRT